MGGLALPLLGQLEEQNPALGRDVLCTRVGLAARVVVAAARPTRVEALGHAAGGSGGLPTGREKSIAAREKAVEEDLLIGKRAREDCAVRDLNLELGG